MGSLTQEMVDFAEEGRRVMGLACALLFVAGASASAQMPPAGGVPTAVINPPPAMRVEGVPPIPTEIVR